MTTTFTIQSEAHFSAIMDALERQWSAQHSGDQNAADTAEYLDHLCLGQEFPLTLDLVNLPTVLTDTLAVAMANVKEAGR